MDDPKRRAARAAIQELPPGPGRGSGPVIVGLGSGSTARLFVEELAAEVRAGREVVGVATSESTRELAASLGIPLLDDVGPWDIALTIDGADEVSASLDLIKGGGAAHAREKIINYASMRNVIIVDGSKLSERLGEKWPVPIEVLPFAHGATRRRLEALGQPVLRVLREPHASAGAPVRTDAGNLIYDLRVPPIDDPANLDRALRSIPGVVETGLFVARADVVLVADASQVRRLVAPTRHPT